MTDRHNQTLEVYISDTEQIGIKILEPTDSISDNLALATWGASFILANQLYKIDVSEALAACTQKEQHFLEPKDPNDAARPPHSPILELGAGTALVGLTAALLWKRNAVLTDLPAIVTGTAATVGANAAALAASNVQVHCGSLDWFKPSQLSFHKPTADSGSLPDLTPESHKFPIILAADVVYDEEHPDLLLQTVTTWLAPGTASRFVLAYVLRHAYLDVIRDLWAKFEDAGLECVEEGQTTGDESWDEMAPYEWCSWRWKE